MTYFSTDSGLRSKENRIDSFLQGIVDGVPLFGMQRNTSVRSSLTLGLCKSGNMNYNFNDGKVRYYIYHFTS